MFTENVTSENTMQLFSNLIQKLFSVSFMQRLFCIILYNAYMGYMLENIHAIWCKMLCFKYSVNSIFIIVL